MLNVSGHYSPAARRREMTRYKEPEEVKRDMEESSEYRRKVFAELISIADEAREKLLASSRDCYVYKVNKPLANVCVALSDFIVKMQIAENSKSDTPFG